MGFLKSLFGGSSETPEEEKKEKEAKDFDILKYDGVAALKQGQLEYAIKCFKHALEIKDDLEIHDYLSQALTRNNEMEPALEQLQILAEAEPENKKIWTSIANLAYMMEDYDRMTEACVKAEAIDKDDPQICYLHARAYIGQKNEIGAIAMLTRTIALKDDFAEAYQLRGETLLKMNDAKGADEDAQWLLNHVREDEDVLLLKARIEHAKHNLDEAIAYYDKVVSVNPFCIPAFRERGAVKLEKGDKAGAEVDAQQLLELNPQEAEGVNGNFEAKGTENIQQKMEEMYKNNNPYGF